MTWRHGYPGDKRLTLKNIRRTLSLGISLTDTWFNPRWYLLEGVERLRRFGTRGELGNPVVKRDWYYFRDLRPVVVVQAPEAAAKVTRVQQCYPPVWCFILCCVFCSVSCSLDPWWLLLMRKTMIPVKPVSLCPYFVCNSLSPDYHGLSVESIFLRFDGKF